MSAAPGARPARRAAASLAAALGVVTLAAGCPQTGYGARRTIERYFDAVQAGDRVGLATLSAEYEDAAHGLEGPAAQAVFEEFSARAQGRLAAYEEAKQSGRLDLGPDGIGLIRGLGLGRGAFYQVRGLEAIGERLRVHLEVNLGYDQIAFERFPEGTRIYLMAPPLGSLLTLVRGEARPEPVRVLSRLQVDCVLEPARTPEHATGWLVRSVSALAGSEHSVSIEWR